MRNPPVAEGFDVAVVVVDNSPDWSPAIKGITETSLVTARKWSDKPSHLKTGTAFKSFSVIDNHKGNKFHASALDCIVDGTNLPYDFRDFDYLMALETDVLVLRPDWLQWFVDQIGDGFAAGHWHHEQFVNPSCTLYRGDVLREFNAVCKSNPENVCRWGDSFEKTHEMNDGDVDWVAGAFAEKRGWPEGTELRTRPTGQSKGPGWYEPGQALHHWAVNQGYDYKVLETAQTEREPGLPTQTFYGFTDVIADDMTPAQMWDWRAYSVHLWAGTRSLDIIKHPTNQDEFNIKNVNFWQQREARFWLDIVPKDVQEQTIELIKKYRWHTKGQGTPTVEPRDIEAGESVEANYRIAGLAIDRKHMSMGRVEMRRDVLDARHCTAWQTCDNG